MTSIHGRADSQQNSVPVSQPTICPPLLELLLNSEILNTSDSEMILPRVLRKCKQLHFTVGIPLCHKKSLAAEVAED